MQGRNRIQKICPECQRPFIFYPSKNKIYCSEKCYGLSQRHRIKRRCLICGKEFEAMPNQIKKGYSNYCSRECYYKSMKRQVIKKCKYCGKEFSVIPFWFKSRLYCSPKCRSLSQRNKIQKICEYCKKEFGIWPSLVEEGKGRFCSRKCRRLGMRGENSTRWKGGISFEPYSPEFNEQLKELIRYRDGYKCQKCGCPEIEEGQKLTIHHIDYNKINCKPDNLITLCRKCNLEVNTNRKKWTKYFQRKVKKIMSLNTIQLNFRFKDEKNATLIQQQNFGGKSLRNNR